jgi:hypothetical protein
MHAEKAYELSLKNRQHKTDVHLTNFTIERHKAIEQGEFALLLRDVPETLMHSVKTRLEQCGYKVTPYPVRLRIIDDLGFTLEVRWDHFGKKQNS